MKPLAQDHVKWILDSNLSLEDLELKVLSTPIPTPEIFSPKARLQTLRLRSASSPTGGP